LRWSSTWRGHLGLALLWRGFWPSNRGQDARDTQGRDAPRHERVTCPTECINDEGWQNTRTCSASRVLLLLLREGAGSSLTLFVPWAGSRGGCNQYRSDRHPAGLGGGLAIAHADRQLLDGLRSTPAAHIASGISQNARIRIGWRTAGRVTVASLPASSATFAYRGCSTLQWYLSSCDRHHVSPVEHDGEHIGSATGPILRYGERAGASVMLGSY